jgi:hypothetical protein
MATTMRFGTTIKPGKRLVDGKSFHLADEVRYIQRRAARHDGRIVSIGQLVLFSTETGDAWLLDPSEQLAAQLAHDGDPVADPHRRNRYHLRDRLEGSLSYRGGGIHLCRSGQRPRHDYPGIPHG